ncbi:MAG: DUF4339 domain-containing protein, partial [Polyangiaceae bacterium]
MNRGVNASIWLWATESGEQHAGSEQELVTCLSSRALPAYTLVWRSGWSEWLPAMQVKELARGLPESSLCAPRVARATAPGVPPPPPPIETYPMLRRWAEELRQSSGPITRREGVPIWAQTVVLNEQPPTSADFEETTDEIPDEVLAEAARLMMEATPPRDLGLAERARRSRTSWPAVILPQEPFAPPLEPPAVASFIDPSSVFDGGTHTQSGLDRSDVGVPGETSERSRSRGWLWLMPAAALAGGLWLTRTHWLPVAGPVSAPEPQVAVMPVRPAATAEPPPAPKVFGCRVLKRPQKLDDWSIPDRPLGVGLAPDGKRIALGYAQSRERAVGLTFDPARFVARGEPADASSDPASVGVTRDFVSYREEEIYSVTPLAASGKLEFRVERVGEKLELGTAIDGVPTLRIGQNEVGMVGGLLGRRPHRIWWLPRPGLTAVPAYTRHPLGFLIAARVGRKDPTLRLGVISPEASPHTALSTLELPRGALGVPAL